MVHLIVETLVREPAGAKWTGRGRGWHQERLCGRRAAFFSRKGFAERTVCQIIVLW